MFLEYQEQVCVCYGVVAAILEAGPSLEGASKKIIQQKLFLRRLSVRYSLGKFLAA